MNGLTLAYIGDAYYELQIRMYLINKGSEKVNDLHKRAIKFTSGKAQSLIITHLLENNVLSEDETTYFKTGRNFSGNNRKNLTPQEYHLATGFEALVGHLYLNNIDRCNEIIDLSIGYIERGI